MVVIFGTYGSFMCAGGIGDLFSCSWVQSAHPPFAFLSTVLNASERI